MFLPKEEEKQKALGGALGASWELDKELQQIYAREFGMNKEALLDYERKKWAKKSEPKEKAPVLKYDKTDIILFLPGRN